MADGIQRESSSAIEAAALGRLHDYLRRAPQATDDEATIARDAFVSGFAYGVRWGIHTTSALSNPEVRLALAVLAESVSGHEGLRP